MTTKTKKFKLQAKLENTEKLADATLILHNDKYFLTKESNLVDSHSRDIFRRTYHGRKEVVDIGTKTPQKGYLFDHPIEAKNYVLGTYAKYIHWVDEETGDILA